MSSSNIRFDDQPWDWTRDTLYNVIYSGQDGPVAFREFFARDDVKACLRQISDKLQSLARDGTIIFPLLENVFRAFFTVTDLKGVILGQDPYHTARSDDPGKPASAVGLCFSLPPNAQLINPSLRNIQKEVANCGFKTDPNSGDLSYWSKQGVLLINSALTVESGRPGSHITIWVEFTEKLVAYLSERYQLFWLLWGLDALQYESDIKRKDLQRLIKCSHPSPLSANRGSGGNPAFIGSKCFQIANDWLRLRKISEIDWSIGTRSP